MNAGRIELEPQINAGAVLVNALLIVLRQIAHTMGLTCATLSVANGAVMG